MALSFSDLDKDFSTLVETGFIAVKHGNESAASRLFHAAQILRPQDSAPVLGFGYVALQSMNLEMAKHLFSAVLKKEPENALAKVLLGFSYLSSKFASLSQLQKSYIGPRVKPEEVEEFAKTGEQLIQEALEASKDPSVHSLGKSALELSKKISDYLATPLK